MKFKFLISVLTFFLTNSAFSACPYHWTKDGEGIYYWVEGIVNTNGEPNNLWNYSLRVFENQDKCEAELKGEGNNLKMHILADIRAEGEDVADIAIVYREKGKEAGIGSEGKKGDVLFKLRWESPESSDLTLFTTWGTMKAQLEKNRENGYHFFVNKIIEFEAGKLTEKGIPLTLTALEDEVYFEVNDLEFVGGEYKTKPKNPPMEKELNKGDKYVIDFFPIGTKPKQALCYGYGPMGYCWYPTLAKDGVLELAPTISFVPKIK